MKIFNLRDALVCFSDTSDGDLSFYNFDKALQRKRWESLEVVSKYNLNFPKYLNQIHGDKFIRVEPSHDLTNISGDGLFTNKTGQPIGVFSADCLPVLFAHKNGAGAVHAGWRGTLENISGQGAQKLAELYNINPKELYAFLGPCINQCCLELGDEIYEDFIKAEPNYRAFFLKNEKWHLDLRDLNKFQLIRAGILNKNIIDIDSCTYCEEHNYYSFRRQKQRNGSMFSFVVLKNEIIKEKEE